MAENLSLFGWPLREAKDGPGRPEHLPTAEIRNRIMMLLALKTPLGDIAAAVGLSTKTLRKHYSQLLDARRIARLQLDAQLWEALYTRAMAGDVSAMKELGRRLNQHDLAELASLSDRVANRGATGTKKAERKGLKEQRREAAGQVSGKFAPPSAPKSLN